MAVNQPVVCAVDAGGTKTLAIVLDANGVELARATTGPGNYVVHEVDRVIANVIGAIEQAVTAAGAEFPIATVWAGMAGIDRAGGFELMEAQLANLASTVRVTNDVQLPLGALASGAGIVLIAGTGSIAFGIDRHGESARAGGWGFLIGDEGSGYDLGRQGIRAAARAADGRGVQTALLPELMTHWNLQEPIRIIDEVYRERDRAALAECARLVFDAADAWDPVAMRLVQNGAAELSLAAGAVEKALDFSDSGVPLVLAGSLLVEREGYRRMVLERIEHQFDINVVHIVEEPAMVAARFLAGGRAG
ncbi:MAG: hypothetical protein M9947_13520 [Thermomicrobiales bacterium]|nr:hypothetical protein [Thermomicrobiales bacterium]